MKVAVIKYRWKYSDDTWDIAGVTPLADATNFIVRYKEQYPEAIRDDLRFTYETFVLGALS